MPPALEHVHYFSSRPAPALRHGKPRTLPRALWPNPCRSPSWLPSYSWTDREGGAKRLYLRKQLGIQFDFTACLELIPHLRLSLRQTTLKRDGYYATFRKKNLTTTLGASVPDIITGQSVRPQFFSRPAPTLWAFGSVLVEFSRICIPERVHTCHHQLHLTATVHSTLHVEFSGNYVPRLPPHGSPSSMPQPARGEDKIPKVKNAASGTARNEVTLVNTRTAAPSLRVHVNTCEPNFPTTATLSIAALSFHLSHWR